MNEIQNRILRVPEVLQITGMSASGMRRAIERGEFPQPIKLGPRAKGWLVSEIQRWLAGLETATAPQLTTTETENIPQLANLEPAGSKDAGDECASNGVVHDLSTNSPLAGE